METGDHDLQEAHLPEDVLVDAMVTQDLQQRLHAQNAALHRARERKEIIIVSIKSITHIFKTTLARKEIYEFKKICGLVLVHKDIFKTLIQTDGFFYFSKLHMYLFIILLLTCRKSIHYTVLLVVYVYTHTS